MIASGYNYWPAVTLAADVEAETPHQHVRQVTDRAYAKSMLAPLESRNDFTPDLKEQQRRANRLLELRAIILREARRHAPKQVLVVPQRDIETALLALGRLPPNVVTAHHNAIAGRDEWRNAAALIVVGRTQPNPATVETVAEALTGAAVTHLASWYDRADATREIVDGTTILGEADRHSDTTAEALRWQICEGELLQIIGRVRGVNRSSTNPVEVLVLTDVPLPLPLAGTLSSVDLTPTPNDLMLAEGGVAFVNARHAAAAYPGLWPSHNAADLAIRRSPSFPYRESILGKRRSPRRAEYQLTGRGSKPAAIVFDPDSCPNPAVFLAEKLGAIAWCRVQEPTADQMDQPYLAPAIQALPVPTDQEGLIPAAAYSRAVPGYGSRDQIVWAPAKPVVAPNHVDQHRLQHVEGSFHI